MKIILSKKGTDNTFGKTPSPVFPDGSLISFPIPDNSSPTKYCDINIDIDGYSSIGELISALNCKYLSTQDFAHLDPDINPKSLARAVGWKPALGQSGSALSHLINQEVDKGDLFLFYGWYREIGANNGQLKFTGKNKQVIWGWLQVEKMCYTEEHKGIFNDPEYAWLQKAHPHMQAGKKERDAVFIATDKLTLPNGKVTNLPGGGVFEKYREVLNLSDPNCTQITSWRLPSFFYPFNGRNPLSYNSNENKWKEGDGCVYLRRASIGQEFVLSEEYINDASRWLDEIFNI